MTVSFIWCGKKEWDHCKEKISADVQGFQSDWCVMWWCVARRLTGVREGRALFVCAEARLLYCAIQLLLLRSDDTGTSLSQQRFEIWDSDWFQIHYYAYNLKSFISFASHAGMHQLQIRNVLTSQVKSILLADTKGIIPVRCSQRADGMAKPAPEDIIDPPGTYSSTLADSTVPTTALKGDYIGNILSMAQRGLNITLCLYSDEYNIVY